MKLVKETLKMKPDWKPIDSAPKDGTVCLAVWERQDGEKFIAITHFSLVYFQREYVGFFTGNSKFGKELSMDGFASPIKWDYLPDMETNANDL